MAKDFDVIIHLPENQDEEDSTELQMILHHVNACLMRPCNQDHTTSCMEALCRRSTFIRAFSCWDLIPTRASRYALRSLSTRCPSAEWTCLLRPGSGQPWQPISVLSISSGKFSRSCNGMQRAEHTSHMAQAGALLWVPESAEPRRGLQKPKSRFDYELCEP